MDSVIRNPNQIHLEALKRTHANFRCFKGKSKVLERAQRYPQINKFHTYYLDKKIQNAKSNRSEGIKHHFAVLRVDNLKSDPNIRLTTTSKLRFV